MSPALPRARCPICHGDVALRKGDVLREHPDHRHHMYGVAGAVREGSVPNCHGSGQAVLPLDALRKGASA